MIRAQDHVRAAGSDLRVSVEVLIGVIARGQFDPEDDAGGHIGGETRIHSHELDVAQCSVVEIIDGTGSREVRRGREVAIPVGNIHHQAPVLVHHVLKADVVELGTDFLVAIIRGGSRHGAAPVLVLVHVIELEVDQARLVLFREQERGAYAEYAAPASAGPHHAGRRDDRQEQEQSSYFWASPVPFISRRSVQSVQTSIGVNNSDRQ